MDRLQHDVLETGLQAPRCDNASPVLKDNIQNNSGQTEGPVENNGLLDSEARADEGSPNFSTVSGKETKIVVITGVAFLCVFTSYQPIQNLQSSLNDEGGLGVISLSVLYAASTFSGFLAPMLITKFGVKPVLIATFAIHFLYTASNFYPSFATLIPSSFLLGMATGPLWTCQGIYITICAYSWSSRTGGEVQKQLGLYNGIFWSICDLYNIVGNLVSSLVLYQGSYNRTETNASVFCGVNDCPGADTEDIIADPEPVIVYTLLGIFLGCVCAGIVVASCCLQPVQPTSTRTPIKALIKSWFRLIPMTDLKFLIPFIFYTAIAEQVISAEMTKSYISCPIGIQNVGYVLIAFGIGRSSAGIISGRLAKYIKRPVQVAFGCSLLIALHIWMLLWIPDEKSTVLIYALCLLYGIALGINSVQFFTALGEMFIEHLSIIFAIFTSIKCLWYAVSFLYSSLLCTGVKLSIAITCLSLALVLYLYTEFRFSRRKRSPSFTKKS